MIKRRAYYYPLLAYIFSLLLVWVMSLGIDLVRLFSDNSVAGNSLMSTMGIRWALRNALPSLDALPWGFIVLSIATVGLLRGSGIARMMAHLLGSWRLTKSEGRALLFSLFAVAPFVALVYMLSFSPWKVLLSVTGELASSPLLQGWLPLLFSGVLFVSLVYGFIYGSYRSIIDVAVSVSDTFSLSVPAVLALVPASGIVSCLQYIGFWGYCGLAAEGPESFATVIYVLPFAVVAVLRLRDDS